MSLENYANDRLMLLGAYSPRKRPEKTPTEHDWPPFIFPNNPGPSGNMLPGDDFPNEKWGVFITKWGFYSVANDWNLIQRTVFYQTEKISDDLSEPPANLAFGAAYPIELWDYNGNNSFGEMDEDLFSNEREVVVDLKLPPGIPESQFPITFTSFISTFSGDYAEVELTRPAYLLVGVNEAMQITYEEYIQAVRVELHYRFKTNTPEYVTHHSASFQAKFSYAEENSVSISLPLVIVQCAIITQYRANPPLLTTSPEIYSSFPTFMNTLGATDFSSAFTVGPYEVNRFEDPFGTFKAYSGGTYTTRPGEPQEHTDTIRIFVGPDFGDVPLPEDWVRDFREIGLLMKTGSASGQTLMEVVRQAVPHPSSLYYRKTVYITGTPPTYGNFTPATPGLFDIIQEFDEGKTILRTFYMFGTSTQNGITVTETQAQFGGEVVTEESLAGDGVSFTLANSITYGIKARGVAQIEEQISILDPTNPYWKNSEDRYPMMVEFDFPVGVDDETFDMMKDMCYSKDYDGHSSYMDQATLLDFVTGTTQGIAFGNQEVSVNLDQQFVSDQLYEHMSNSYPEHVMGDPFMNLPQDALNPKVIVQHDYSTIERVVAGGKTAFAVKSTVEGAMTLYSAGKAVVAFGTAAVASPLALVAVTLAGIKVYRGVNSIKANGAIATGYAKKEAIYTLRDPVSRAKFYRENPQFMPDAVNGEIDPAANVNGSPTVPKQNADLPKGQTNPYWNADLGYSPN